MKFIFMSSYWFIVFNSNKSFYIKIKHYFYLNLINKLLFYYILFILIYFIKLVRFMNIILILRDLLIYYKIGRAHV